MSIFTWPRKGTADRPARSFRKPRPISRLGFEQLEDRSLMAVADLVAYRPVTEFINHLNYPVAEAVETDPKLGPGIRVNGDDDNANGVRDFSDAGTLAAGDNDLVRVHANGSAGTYTVSWTGPLAVWTSPAKAAPLVNGAVGIVMAGQALWVEYVSETHTSASAPAALSLTVADDAGNATDSVAFHSFQSVVVAIGGNAQNPQNFGDPRLGIFTLGGALYAQGYDVQLFSYDKVNSSGQGAAYNEVASAVLSRNVDSVAILGYSWGGGGTYQLAAALKANTALAAAGYKLQYTAYIDGIRQSSISAETRLPPGTRYHDNYYQRKDFLLKGNSVAGANNVNVTSTTWGKSLSHTTIDDNATVQTALLNSLKTRLTV